MIMARFDPSLRTSSLPAISRREFNPASNWRETLMTWYTRFFSPRSQKMPNPLSTRNFDEFVLRHPLAVVHFWAPWNEADRLMNQLLQFQLPEKLRRQVAFASVNIDLVEHLELIRQHKVFDVPFLVFYRDGLAVQNSMGLHGPGVITKHLQELIKPR